MKKLCVMLAAVLLALGLAGCGGGTQVALVQSQFEALDDLFQRAGTAVAAVDAVTAASGNLVNAGFTEYYSRLASQRDAFAESVEGAKKLEDEEVAALLVDLERAVAEAKPVVANLEAIVPQVEQLGTSATALVADMQGIIPLATQEGASPELQREYTELAAAYQGLEAQLNETLAQSADGGLDTTLQALRQANETMSQLCERASALLAGLKA